MSEDITKCMFLMLDLSTKHMPNNDPDFGKYRVTKHEFGFFIHGGYWTDDCPSWLKPIMGQAIKNNCATINFDADGIECNLFNSYDW
jgi:hypothetical protein